MLIQISFQFNLSSKNLLTFYNQINNFVRKFNRCTIIIDDVYQQFTFLSLIQLNRQLIKLNKLKMNLNSHFKRQKPRIISNLGSQTKKQQIKSFSSNKKIYSSSENQHKHKIVFNDIYRKNNSKSKRVYMTYNSQGENFVSSSFNLNNNKVSTIAESNQNHLKTKNNQSCLKKAKSNASSQKYGKQQKKLSIQYEKQLYWNANSQYLVAGVKLQYEKYKQMYQQKCSQLRNLQIEVKKNSIQELKTYIAVLEMQSKKLYEKYKRIKGKKQLKDIIFEDPAKNQQMLMQTFVKLQREEYKNKTLQQINKTIRQQNKDLKKKLKLVERLLIEKQNAEFNALSQMRRSQKKQKELKQKIIELQANIQEQVQKAQKSIKNLAQNMKQGHERQYTQISAKLRKYSEQVQKLTKQNKYLKNLLDQWQQNPKDSKQYNGNKIQNNQKTNASKSIQNKIMQNQSANFVNSKQPSFQNINQNQQVALKRKRQKKQDQNSYYQNQGQLKLNILRQANKNKKKSAGIKTQNSTKNRRIQFFQIQSLVQFLNYKLAFKKVNKKQLKQHFNPFSSLDSLQRQKNQNQNLSTLTNQRLYQKSELITMKQIQQIFIKEPFKLNQAQANILARYFVQDVVQQFVYTHPDNSIQRTVAESIAVNLFSKYTILKSQTSQKCQAHLQKFKANILGALNYQAKGGYVSRQKFKDFMSGLGLKGDQQISDYMISKMSVSSQSLQRLNYNALYE